MSSYKEFQFGSFISVALLSVLTLNTYLFVIGAGNNPMSMNQFIFSDSVLVLIFLLFYGLTTTIDNRRIVVSFGVGLVRKRIYLDRIKQINIVKNKWFYGWGYRFIPGGILLNISGFDAIELEFNDRDRVIRIGTENPSHLREEILRRLPKVREGNYD